MNKGISPGLLLTLEKKMINRLEKGAPDGTVYELTNPIRRVDIRSALTVDVSTEIGRTERKEMFLATDPVTGATGEPVLTSEPRMEHGQGISTGLILAHFGGYWRYNSADIGPADSRLVQRALFGSLAFATYTNKRLLGPWQTFVGGQGVNREDLVDGAGAVAVDAGVLLSDIAPHIEPNPLVQWPKTEINPFFQFDGTRFATVGLTTDFILEWTMLSLAADVRPRGNRGQVSVPASAPVRRRRR